MKKCIKCGKEMPANYQYCEECGALQWYMAKFMKQFCRAQQILINFVGILLILILTIFAGSYKNVDNSNIITAGLISSIVIIFVILFAFNIVIEKYIFQFFGFEKYIKNKSKIINKLNKYNIK